MRKRQQRLPETPITATIEKQSHDGRGIARVEGKITFIEGALPSETVRFTYTRRKQDFDEGRLLEVITPSVDRVKPNCPHYTVCGGCASQHVAPQRQIEMKEASMLDALRRIGHCEPETILEPLMHEPWHYRTKARLSVRYVEKKQSTLVGFRERAQPRYIADIQTCAILDARVAKQMLRMRELIHALDDPRCIAQIEVATSPDEVALVLRHLTPLSDADIEKLCAFATEVSFKLFLQPEGPDSIHLLFPKEAHPWLTYDLPEFGVNYRFYPSDFTQVNQGMNRMMVHLALDLLALESTDMVLDLFCGLGNFSLPMAKLAAYVVGVEGSQAMVLRARANAEQNEIKNIEFQYANLEEKDALKAFASKKFTKILLDPPRTGALEVVSQISKLEPERIVYVSCNPVTLARDAGVLVHQHGYRLVSAGVMDMFPHTAHVESIALFVKE